MWDCAQSIADTKASNLTYTALYMLVFCGMHDAKAPCGGDCFISRVHVANDPGWCQNHCQALELRQVASAVCIIGKYMHAVIIVCVNAQNTMQPEVSCAQHRCVVCVCVFVCAKEQIDAT